MNTEHLKIFYYTAKFKNFTKAAEFLNITQPSVTRLIYDFQDKLGLVLINKNGKSFVLTDPGKKIYEMAEKIFEIELKIEECVRDIQQQKSGIINILTTETYGAHFMPEFLVEYKRLYPGIMINVTTLPNDQVVDLTSRLECDFGIISKKLKNQKLLVKNLLEEKIVLISAPDKPLAKRKELSPREVNNLPIILFEEECGTNEAVMKFKKKNNLEFDVRCIFSNSESVKSLVKKGLGYAFISRNVIKNEVARNELVEINVLDETLVRQFYIIYHKEKYISNTLKTFIDIMIEWSDKYTEKIRQEITQINLKKT
ncbi:MAG: LysR family transcriptional regulator [Spirochaetales bacterium]|nr:LysR family transcriptional regulator [Spirochaetales bacterium]